MRASRLVSLSLVTLVLAGSITGVGMALVSTTATSSPPPPPKAGNWRVVQSPDSWTYNYTGATCEPGTQTCFLSGGTFGGVARLTETTDGGTSWSSLSNGLPSLQAGMDTIVCPSASTCFGGGGAMNNTTGTIVPSILVSTNGAATWSNQTLPAGIINGTDKVIRAVACGNTSDCFAFTNGGSIVATTNGGGTWSTQTSPTGNAFHGAACPSATNCFAVADSGTIVA
ncbi:MAG TPA: hypothetical protein VK277_08645, partial [Acidimicrobiales bacterium]|nr:hypothetical protein [Acidimicrobiales bacterium]